MLVLWWFVLGISVIIYIIAACFVLPKTLLRAGDSISAPKDRGLKTYKEKNGHSIVYEPQKKFRKFVSQYILSDRDGKKIIVCKLSGEVSYLDYDIALFNSHGKVFKVVNIKETVEQHGISCVTELPVETAYATLILNRANDIDFENNAVNRISKQRQGLFALLAGILMMAEVFFVKLCLANIFGDVFHQDFVSSAKSILITCGAGVVAAGVNIAAFIYVINNPKRQSGSAVKTDGL